MNAHTRKSLTRITQCFFLFLVLRLAEELLIVPRFNSRGLIACLGGFVVLLVYIRFINKPLENIGMIFSEHKIRKAIILAALINLVPAVIVYALEYFRVSAAPGHTVITAFYDSVQYAYSSAGLPEYVMWLAFGMLVNVIHAFFYEIAFRGLLITLGSRSMHFWKINLIQSGLYTFWFLIPVVRLLMYYSSEDLSIHILTLFIVMLVYQMLTAVRLGLLRLSTGSVWACIFDHFACACILDMIHVQYTASDMTVQLDQNYYLRVVGYQAVSLLMVFIYYMKKKHK